MTNSIILKFTIGFIAGLCAAMFPRLIAALATVKGNGGVDLFGQYYFGYSLIFAVLIGVVITIFEWDNLRSPKDIFMSALAIPAVLSGSINMASGVNDLEQAEKELDVTTDIFQEELGIPNYKSGRAQEESASIPFSLSRINIHHFFIRSAHADSGGTIQVAQYYGIGIRKNRDNYVVVLDQAESKNKADQKAAEYSSKGISAKVIKDNGNGYVITTNSAPQNKVKALVEAAKLKRDKRISPSLMKIKK